jgi:hypothetical protein
MFWLLGVPLGVGLGWWLWPDAPFNPAMVAAAEPAPRQRETTPAGVSRAGSGPMFLLDWAAAIGMAVVLAIAVGVQGSTNGASDPTVLWTLVAQTSPSSSEKRSQPTSGTSFALRYGASAVANVAVRWLVSR